jgi:hypothetical protein
MDDSHIPFVQGFNPQEPLGRLTLDQDFEKRLAKYFEKGVRLELGAILRREPSGELKILALSLIPGPVEPKEEPVVIRPRLAACVVSWPDCAEGEYNPACCRFPKACSCTIYPDDFLETTKVEAIHER